MPLRRDVVDVEVDDGGRGVTAGVTDAVEPVLSEDAGPLTLVPHWLSFMSDAHPLESLTFELVFALELPLDGMTALSFWPSPVVDGTWSNKPVSSLADIVLVITLYWVYTFF